MRRFLLALQFLTRIPVRLAKVEDADFPASMTWFPAVGAVIGMVLALAFYLLHVLALPGEAIAAMVLVVSVVITGGLHLDGLSDCADGFYAGRSKEDVLRIMDDSHIGAMGTIVICCALLARYGLLVGLLETVSAADMAATLIVSTTVSRWAMVFSSVVLAPAKEHGLGHRFVVGLRRPHWIIATIMACVFSIVLMEMNGLILLVTGLILTLVTAIFVKRRIGGLTGDTLGATCEIAEVGTLFAACLLTIGCLQS